MEEYKRIAPLLAIPSLATLLFSASAVLWHNWYLFHLPGDCIAASVLSVAAVLSAPFIAGNRPRQHAVPSADNTIAGTHPPGWKIPIRTTVFLLLITTACAAAAVIRNHANTGHAGVPALAPPFTAEVQSARALSYSRELILLIESAGNNTGHSPLPLKAIAYAPRSAELRPGDKIVLHAKACPLNRNQASGDGALFRQELLRKGFRATFYIRDDQYTVLSRGTPSWRDRIRTAIETRTAALFNNETCSLLKALYFGNKNYISRNTVTLFREAGALHILAASGTHCAIIALIPFLLLSPFRISKRIIFLSSILLLALYLYLTDMPVSLQRAFIMCAIFGIAFVFDFDRNPFNALFAAGTILIIMYPYEPYSIGFQLTFGATFGILTWYRSYREILSMLPKILRNPIALTLSAQVLVFPIIFFHFREVNISSLISNLIIVPGVQAILAGSILLTTVSSMVPWDISILALPVDLAYAAVTGAAGFISRLHLHFSNITAGPALIVPYLLYLSPIIPAGKLRAVQLPCLGISFFFAAVLLLHSAGPLDSCGILVTGNSIMTTRNTPENPVLFGKLGSRVDTEALIRYITRHHMKNISLYITEAEFKNMQHYTRLIKHADISRCYLPSDFQYGKYIKPFLAASEQNNITISFFEPRNHAPSSSGRQPSGHPAETCRNVYLSIVSNQQQETSLHNKCGTIR